MSRPLTKKARAAMHKFNLDQHQVFQESLVALRRLDPAEATRIERKHDRALRAACVGLGIKIAPGRASQ